MFVASACSTDGSTTTTSPPSSEATATTSTTETTPLPVSTTQPAPPDVSLIVSRFGGVDLLTDGGSIALEGDADYRVIVAFDDLAGGLVYQYEITPEQFPADSILRIPPGGSTPEVVLSAEPGRTIRLLDVEVVEGRTNILYLDGPTGSDPDSLLVADLAGGAPTLVARAEASAAPGAAGVTPTAMLNGSLSERGVAVVWWYGDIEAACSYVEVVDFEGATLFGPVPEVCGEHDLSHAALSADGSRLAYAGTGSLEVVDTASGDALGEWDVGEVVGVDFDGTTVIITETEVYSLLSLRGEAPAAYPITPVALVTMTRGPVDVPAGTFLGGVRALSTACSSAGFSQTPTPQGGLPETVATTRTAIVAAATACDIEALTSLVGESFTYSFGAGENPGRFWRRAEQEGYGDLARIVGVLELPFVIQDSTEGRIYTWPSAFQETPTDDDWEALGAVYNEEDIDLFKEYGGYIGMRVGIAEDGTWIFAVAGD
jgi:hypothetical protein